MTKNFSADALPQGSRVVWVVALLAAILFVVSNLPWQLDDYDQAKQAFTSFEMVNQGSWLYQTTPHDRVATKPPLVGWISAALFAVTRSWELAWRLPSLAAAIATGFLLFRFGLSAYGAAPAVFSVSAFVFNLLTPRLATLVRTDMPLAFVIFVIGVQVWNKIRKGEPWRPSDRLYIFLLLTAGMLIKGPVVWAFLLPGLLAFQFWKGKAGVSAFPGVWPWIASLVIFGMWAAGGIRFMPGFYDEVVVREFLGRFGGETHRAQPLLFYLPHLLQKFAPWSLAMIALAIIQLRSANWNWRHVRISRETAWLICWSASGIVVMSLLPSKRVDRIFPVIPPLCLLLGAQIATTAAVPRWQPRVYRWAVVVLVSAVLISGTYFGWKAVNGYRVNRGALSAFGTNVFQQARANSWRYAVVSSPDEGLLLYAHKLGYVRPERAVIQWNAGDLDALIVSTRGESEIMSQLNPSGRVALRSTPKNHSDTLDYILITKSTKYSP